MSWIDSRKCLLCQTGRDVVTLFRFPPRPEIKKKWASFCNMDPDLLTTKDCLCINHFTSDQIVPRLPTSKKTKLRLTAVPCIMNSSTPPAIPCRTKKIPNPRLNGSSPTFVDVTSCDDIMPKSKKKKIIAQPELPSESVLDDPIDLRDEDLSSLVEFEKITVINLTSSSENPAAKKSVRYIGDVTAEHLQSHEDAVKYFFMAKNALEDSRKKVRILRRVVAGLRTRVKKYEDILKRNGERKEDLISDDDFTWPLEEDTMTDEF